MGCHVTFNFNLRNVKLAGWGVNFWHSSDDIPTVKLAAATLGGIINQMTAIQCVIPSVRISTDGKFRITDEINPFLPNPSTPTPSTDADYVTVSHQIKLLAFNGRKATIWISGLPDAVTANSGTYSPTGKYQTNLNAMFVQLSTNGWALRGLPRPQVFKDISAVDQTAGQLTVPAHGFGGPGTVCKIRVRQVKFLPNINGVWKVTVVDANTLKMAGWTSIAVPLPVGLKTAVCSIQTYDYSPIIYSTDATKPTSKPGIITSHKRGRPQDLLGGRRKKRPT